MIRFNIFKLLQPKLVIYDYVKGYLHFYLVGCIKIWKWWWHHMVNSIKSLQNKDNLAWIDDRFCNNLLPSLGKNLWKELRPENFLVVTWKFLA